LRLLFIIIPMNLKHCSKWLILLLCIIVFYACKKNDPPTPPTPLTPKYYWEYFKRVVKTTDEDFHGAVSTPDSFIHVAQWGTLYAMKLEGVSNGYLTYRQTTKFFRSADEEVNLRNIAGGKDGEIYMFPSYPDRPLNELFRLDKDYKTLTKLDYNLSMLVIQYYSLCTDKKGDLYVALTAADGNSGTPCYVVHSSTKGETFDKRMIPESQYSDVRKVKADDNGVPYVSMSDGRILYYDNPSRSWKTIYQTPSSVALRDFVIESTGNIYVATSNGAYYVTNYGAVAKRLTAPSDMSAFDFYNLHLSPKGTLYATTDTVNVRRQDYSTTNCYFSKDKGLTWNHVEPLMDGAGSMKLMTIDYSGRLVASFTDTTQVPKQWGYKNVKYIQLGITTNPAE